MTGEPQPVVILEYDPAWPALFEQEKQRLLTLLPVCGLVVEHIGSTAVPGLAAKPIIDIMIGVPRLAEDLHCLAPLERVGYRYVPEFEQQMPYRRYFDRRGEDGRVGYHLHMVEPTHEFWPRHLLFRDYLREHAGAAAEYARLKRELAARFGCDRESYTDAKSEFVRGIEQRARLELRERTEATMAGLSAKHCVPCRGGVPALKRDEYLPLLNQLHGWDVIDNHHLSKNVSFPDFATALVFVNKVGEVAEREGHHPNLYLSWGKVGIQIWTHKVDGLTESDFILAAKIDELPRE